MLIQPKAVKNMNELTGKILWGLRVDPTGLPEIFSGENAPKEHILRQHPPAGIDNLHLTTTDYFFIRNLGQFSIDFRGYFQVTRSEPSTNNWATATVHVNFTDLKLFGNHEKFGPVTVDLNPGIISAGNTYPASQGLLNGSVTTAACKINVAARFHLHDLNMTLFNKIPIRLTNDNVQGIPTIGEGGKAELSALPLYDWNAPETDHLGYVQELHYMVGGYMKRADALMYRAAKTPKDFEIINSRFRPQ